MPPAVSYVYKGDKHNGVNCCKRIGQTRRCSLRLRYGFDPKKYNKLLGDTPYFYEKDVRCQVRGQNHRRGTTKLCVKPDEMLYNC